MSLAASSSKAPSKANKFKIYVHTIEYCTLSRRFTKCNGYTICEALVKTMNGLPTRYDWWDRDTFVKSAIELENLQDSDGGVIYLRDVELEEVYGPAAFRAAWGLKILDKTKDIREDAWATKWCEYGGSMLFMLDELTFEAVVGALKEMFSQYGTRWK